VKVGNEDPGPQRMMAWNPGAGNESACGILRPVGMFLNESALERFALCGEDNVLVALLLKFYQRR
jgi:hypothetical protein